MPPLVMLNVPPMSSSSLSCAVAGAAAEIGDRLLDLGEAHLVGVAHDRHDEAVRAADGDAHVHEVLVDDVVAVDLGVDGREFLQRGDARLDEEGHEAEPDAAMLLLERVAVFGTQRHRGRHVHLVEGGQHGGVVLRLLEAHRDGAAQARHLHALLALFERAGRLGGLSGRRAGRGGGAAEELEHVALGDAAILAGAGAEVLRLQAALLHDLGGRRHRARGRRHRRAVSRDGRRVRRSAAAG